MRLAVVSPFLDRAHGTERVVAEQAERLARDFACEIHLYAHQVRDVNVSSLAECREAPSGRILWHRVPALPGPHLLRFCWWYFANRICRWRDRRFRGVACDLVFSPGINAADADAVAVHVVFHDVVRRLKAASGRTALSPRDWPRRLHRRLYYGLLMRLEKRIYKDPRVRLSAVSALVAAQLAAYFQRSDVAVIHSGVDTKRFSPQARGRIRPAARAEFGLGGADFGVLFIGNDWNLKGLPALLRALGSCSGASTKLLVVGEDQSAAIEPLVQELGLAGRVTFLAPSADVLPFYAAADVYAGPSLGEAFGLPVLEAMACGIPVIASGRSGVSEVLRDGVDGFVLPDPEDHAALAARLAQLSGDAGLCRRIGEAAAQTASKYTWERNAEEMWKFLRAAAAQRREAVAGAVPSVN